MHAPTNGLLPFTCLLFALGGAISCEAGGPFRPCPPAAAGTAAAIKTTLVGGQARLPLATLQPSAKDPPSSEAPVTNGEAYLADAAGRPFPGLHYATNDGGAYTVKRVPAGYTYQVLVRATSQAGKPVQLRGLARADQAGANAEVNVATTILTLALTEGLSGMLGDFDAAKFQQAVQKIYTFLANEQSLDLNNPSALITLFKRYASLDPSLLALYTDLRAALSQPQGDLATVVAQFALLNGQSPGASSPRPSPAAAAMASPQPFVSQEPTPTPLASAIGPTPAPGVRTPSPAPVAPDAATGDGLGVVLGTFPVGRDPRAIAIDATGFIWVANFADNTLTKLDSAGTLQGTFEAGAFTAPTGIGFDTIGNVWVSNLNNVHRFTQDGEGERLYTTAGGAHTGLAIDIDDSAWVTNNSPGDPDVIKLDRDGNLLAALSVGSSATAVATDPAGNAWVVTPTATFKLSPLGAILTTLRTTATRLALDRAGNVWLSQSNVTKWTSSGALVNSISLGATPGVLAADEEGNVWVALPGVNPGGVVKLSPSGVVVASYAVGRSPAGIAFDVAGNAWVTNSGDGTVSMLAP